MHTKDYELIASSIRRTRNRKVIIGAEIQVTAIDDLIERLAADIQEQHKFFKPSVFVKACKEEGQ